MARLGSLKDFGTRNKFPLALLGIVGFLLIFASSHFAAVDEGEVTTVGVQCTVAATRIGWLTSKHVDPRTYNYSSRFKYTNMSTDFVQVVANGSDISKTEVRYGVGTNHTCIYQRRTAVLEYDMTEGGDSHPRNPKMPQSEVAVLVLLGFCGLSIVLYIYDSERNRRKNFTRLDKGHEFKTLTRPPDSDNMSARTDDDDDDDVSDILLTASSNKSSSVDV
jgi:hypothetical protein